jgi:RNA polymerase sigma factor (sigma-70 family)
VIADSELLRRYRESRCERAFTELVERHIDFVYSAARRQVAGNADLAKDVAQQVFIDLAQKASSLSADTVLTAWLYSRTRFGASKALRTEQRRQAREEKACMEPQPPSTPEPGWNELQPVLDTVMHELDERDRTAVLLRYFERRPLADVGAKLGLTEDAARMRLGRALDKLRQLLARRGITSTTAALAGLLAQQTVTAAPAGLALNIAGTALASVSVTTTGLTLSAIMATKLKIALATATVIALATPLVMQHRTNVKLREETQLLRAQNEQLALTAAENARLSNLLRDAKSRPIPQANSSNELLKLRGDVARLREDSRELARLKADVATNSSQDPSIQATLQTLAARAAALKRHLEERPQTKIPELQFVTDKQWIDAVAKGNLDTEEGIREALGRLRSSAKETFGSMMQKALKQYAAANGGMLPNDISELQSYFNPPIDPATLKRYELAQSGSLEESRHDKPLISETAPPVDDEYDTRYDFEITGNRWRIVSKGGQALQAAMMAYANANNGLLPRDPAHLTPYLREPIALERIQKFLGDIPPNIRTVDQMRERRGG